MKRLLSIVFFLELAGCRSAALDFTEVRIESYPPNGGFAQKSVRQDGKVTGSHLSASAAPPGGTPDITVFETESKASSRELQALNIFVSNARAAPAFSADPCPGRGAICVIIEGRNGNSYVASALFGQKFEAQVAQDIWEAVYQYNVGAW